MLSCPASSRNRMVEYLRSSSKSLIRSRRNVPTGVRKIPVEPVLDVIEGSREIFRGDGGGSRSPESLEEAAAAWMVSTECEESVCGGLSCESGPPASVARSTCRMAAESVADRRFASSAAGGPASSVCGSSLSTSGLAPSAIPDLRQLGNSPLFLLFKLACASSFWTLLSSAATLLCPRRAVK